MTATDGARVAPDATASPEADRTANDGPRFDRRRFLAPIGVALVIIVLTITSALVEAPYPSRDTFLSPVADNGHGASILADRLEAAGVTVDRRTDASDVAGIDEVGTLFVPAPAYAVDPEMARLISRASRVVLVMPQNAFAIGLQRDGTRAVAEVVPPGDRCPSTAAVEAGPASVRQDVYVAGPTGPGWSFCYENGLAVATVEGVEFVVGSAEPFANDHIDRAGNSALATALLGSTGHVTWIDDHEAPESVPPEIPEGDDENPYEGERPDIPIPYEVFDQQVDPMYEVLPSWLWAGLVGILVVLIAAALWRGRRLGPPILEPLPVTVAAAETAMGRARLYQRAGAHQRAFDAIRAGAVATMRPLARIPATARPDDIVAALATKAGWNPANVQSTLFPPPITTANGLSVAVHALDALVEAVQRTHHQGRS